LISRRLHQGPERIAGLIKDRTRLRNRAQTQDVAILKRQTKARLAQVERQITELDTEIAALIAAGQTTARNRDILCSMPGIGTVTAAAMLTLMPEVGTLDRKQVASLAGLAPITRQSGQWQGKALIGGGRKTLRDALYMPALVAMRFNPDLKAKYEHLRSAGKPAKVAIVAVMRKLIEMANALVKADRTWPQKPLDQDGYSKPRRDRWPQSWSVVSISSPVAHAHGGGSAHVSRRTL